MQCSAVQCSAVQCSAVQCNAKCVQTSHKQPPICNASVSVNLSTYVPTLGVYVRIQVASEEVSPGAFDRVPHPQGNCGGRGVEDEGVIQKHTAFARECQVKVPVDF